MEFVFLNIIGNFSPVASCYTGGVVIRTLFRKSRRISSPALQEMVRSGQFSGIIGSLFDTPSNINIFTFLRVYIQLSASENLVGNTKKYIKCLVKLSLLSALFAAIFDVGSEVLLLDLMKENLTYYTLKKYKTRQLHDGGLIPAIHIVAFYSTYLLDLYSNPSLNQIVLACMIPGHILYCFETLSQVYTKSNIMI